MKKAIHQIVPNLRSGDAIGNTTLALQKLLRTMGYDSEIYYESCSSDLKDSALPAKDYLQISSPDNLVIFHYSIGSELNRFVYHLPDNVILVYHNITPPEYFVDIHNHVVGELFHGRKQLHAFKDRAILAVGDSEFNRQELEDAGFPHTDVFPLVIEFSDFDKAPDPVMMDAFDDHMANFFFVGRIVPNKAIEDLIKLYAHYKKFVSHDARLIIAGDWSGFEPYYQRLMKLAYDIDLPDFIMTGRVDFSQLIALYRSATVFLTTSKHEGFCVPLLEAMYCDVPVVALDNGAIGETMGGAGILLDKLNYLETAELLNMIVEPGVLRERIIAGQRKRLQDYQNYPFEDKMKKIIKRAEKLMEAGK